MPVCILFASGQNVIEIKYNIEIKKWTSLFKNLFYDMEDLVPVCTFILQCARMAIEVNDSLFQSLFNYLVIIRMEFE